MCLLLMFRGRTRFCYLTTVCGITAGFWRWGRFRSIKHSEHLGCQWMYRLQSPLTARVQMKMLPAGGKQTQTVKLKQPFMKSCFCLKLWKCSWWTDKSTSCVTGTFPVKKRFGVTAFTLISSCCWEGFIPLIVTSRVANISDVIFASHVCSSP